MSEHTAEVVRGDRFAFGENWSAYVSALTPARIRAAGDSLCRMLGLQDLTDMTFLDVGSGSGLFSLAARQLGAKVRSFDYDPASVSCTLELRERYCPDDPNWVVEEGSILNQDYVGRLGSFDIVYSWGVLHHTGAMWQAFENIVPLVSHRGRVAVAIYNDQGRTSVHWKKIKRAYCKSPWLLKQLILIAAAIRLWGPTSVRDLSRGKMGATWRAYTRNHERGMSPWHDVVDWVGGYPFEVAKPEVVFEFFRARDFHLSHLKTCGGGLGCNEFVFQRHAAP